ncbi:glucokinase [Stagnihabitans tardus]|uniref:Glucokinase n=1 Tax=Stagnihabitans tardus TaxID=2699202 RepID=A0AAE4YCM2_9RHOB|nr:glucokinase [Stagnihabitans tardus]NBZ87505.1 glucokinase [Stagnihabitans tardus]
MTAILADIGGTNTRVALADGRHLREGSIAKFANAEFDGLEPILRRYMSEAGLSAVEGACVAAAGPVVNGVAEMTNLSWVIDRALLNRATGASKVAILNDLQAQGQALGHIAPEFLRPVVAGKSVPNASMLVVGLGTGVNAAPVHNTPWGRVVPPSECGHSSMPIRDARDLALAQFIETHGDHAHGFAGIEDALAGRGFERVYAFVTQEAGALAPRSSAEIMAELAAGGALAREAARLYIKVLGNVLGNQALTHLPYGGMFLIGGMARALTPWMAEFGLKEALCDKGRFHDFLMDFPVWVVEDDFAALTGCAAYLAGGGIG